MNNLLEKNKILFLPLAFFAIVTVAIVAEISFIYNRVSSVRQEISLKEQEVQRLQERVSTLQNFENFISAENTSSVTVALPPQNSALLVTSQIRNEAAELGVVIEDLSLSITPSLMEDFTALGIEFDISGDYESISLLISNISEMTPLINIKSIDIESTREEILASIEMESYWSPYPESLPPVTQTINGVTPEEQSILNQIASFQSPAFQASTTLTPTETEPRENPFALE